MLPVVLFVADLMQLLHAMRTLLPQIEDQDYVLAFVLIECHAFAGGVLHIEHRRGIRLPSGGSELIERSVQVIALRAWRGIAWRGRDPRRDRAAEYRNPFVGAGRHV